MKKWGSIIRRIRQFFPTVEHERKFLNFQVELRKGGTHVLEEAMAVLDIVDAKATGLLSYISLSFAAMVLLLTTGQTNQELGILFFNISALKVFLLGVILALLVSIILCLSCLNIVGAHTIMRFKDQGGQSEYEHLIVKVTLGRRNRYLVAHRISIATAIFVVFIFVLMLLWSIVHLQ